MTAPQAPARGRSPVPVRIIAAAIAMVIVAVAVVTVLLQVERILVWLAISAFVATTLWPLVDVVQRRLHLPRTLAVLLVFVTGGALLAGLLALLVAPLVTQGRDFVDQLPDYVNQARAGRGPVGSLVTRLHLDTFVKDNQQKIQDGITGLGGGAAHVAGVVTSTVAALASIVVLSFLMILEGPKLLAGGLNALEGSRRTRVEAVGRDCARAVTGYMAGNLLISVICGSLTFVALTLLGVPYSGVLAVFVAVTDLIPMVGATIGAVVAIAVAFLHGVPAGFIATGFFVVYQETENHLLQPVVLSRAVKINPLVVLVSLLLGVQLLGILGALLSIPAAGVVQVLLRDYYDHRSGRVKATPTVGEDEVSLPPTAAVPATAAVPPTEAVPATAAPAVRGALAATDGSPRWSDRRVS